MAYKMSEAELTTVLAALRYWQAQTGEKDRPEIMQDHFAGIEPLGDTEIDELCEKLNMGDEDHPTDEAMREAARRLYHDEGTLEIDDDAKVSRAEGNPDKGAYVEAWVWIEDEEAREPGGK